jgi:hypothetical protein
MKHCCLSRLRTSTTNIVEISGITSIISITTDAPQSNILGKC